MVDSNRVVVILDSYEQHLMVSGLTDFRNALLCDRKPAEDVEDLILKIIDAPPEKKRWVGREAR